MESNNYLALFNPEISYRNDIVDNLPEYTWNSSITDAFYNGIIFACPSSGGLWYRDDLAVGINENKATQCRIILQLSIYPNPANRFYQLLLMVAYCKC